MMVKATFYRCVRSEGGVSALKTSGYSEKDIGIHREGEVWKATHIPTGMGLTRSSSTHKTRNQALKEALTLIEACQDFDEKIKQTMESDIYKKFADSRYSQSATTVF